jgi:hypothetical protein
MPRADWFGRASITKPRTRRKETGDQAAAGFKDRLRQIVARSSIYQVEAEALSRQPKPGV